MPELPISGLTTHSTANDNDLFPVVDIATGVTKKITRSTIFNGAQTIAGIKTFSSIPVLPASDPTTDNQAARKKYVDGLISALSSVYVNVSGDTMSGNLNMGSHSISAITDLLLDNGGSVGRTSGLGSFSFGADGKINVTTPEMAMGGNINMDGYDITGIMNLTGTTIAVNATDLINISATNSSSIKGGSALAQFNSGASNDILLTSDNGASAQTFFYLDPNEINIDFYGSQTIGLNSSGIAINSSTGIDITTTSGDVTVNGDNIYNLVDGGYTKAWEELTQTYASIGFGSSDLYIDSTVLQFVANGGANIEITANDGADISLTSANATIGTNTSATIDSPTINLVGTVYQKDNTDNTKIKVDDISGYTTATTRTVTWQDKDITVAGINNETFTDPTIVTSATALTDAATIDLTTSKHTLASSSATRTFTISYTGDDITIEVTLNTTSSVFTFPATSLCSSEGIASGDNTLSLDGASGDKYIIGIKKIGSNYYVACKNFGQ